jgi:hypothetical protein
MPRVNTIQKAAKDYPDHGIKKEDTYYWWKFRYGGKRMSKTYPKSSQLTQSEYLSSIYSIQERDIEGDFADLESLRDELVNELQEISEGLQERLDNIPEGLQQGSTGELLQERIDCVDGVVSELEGISFDMDEEEDCEEADIDEKADEIRSALENLA